MKLCDKIRYLREVEGQLRGLGRAMTQGELVRAIADEMHAPISQSYLSQIESGARPHLTNTTRLLLAKFFKVHPGYLVEEPEGYQAELLSDLRGGSTLDEKLDLWLIGGAERFRRDPELHRALLAIAKHEDTRGCLLLLETVLETPQLAERLLELLRPEAPPRSLAARLPNGPPHSPRRTSTRPALVSRGRADAPPRSAAAGASSNGSSSLRNEQLETETRPRKRRPGASR